MPALEEVVSSHQHTMTKSSPYMEPVGRQHEDGPQGAVAGIAQDAADIDSLLKSSQTSPTEPPETSTETPVFADGLSNDVGGDVRHDRKTCYLHLSSMWKPEHREKWSQC